MSGTVTMLLPHAAKQLAERIEAYCTVYAYYIGQTEREALYVAIGHLRGQHAQSLHTHYPDAPATDFYLDQPDA